MVSFRQEPYLWIHLAGLATVPFWAAICLAGLATGDPVLPVWLEVGLLIGMGTVPILWMQWQRPFYIFSVVVLSLMPTTLTSTQRQLLTLFRTWPVRLLTLAGAAVLSLLLWQIYQWAPIAAATTPWVGASRVIGLTIAALAFLAMNLFVQVPLSVLWVLLAQPITVADAVPYPVGSIARDFSIIGLRMQHLLPTIRFSQDSPGESDGLAEVPEMVETPEIEPSALSTPYESYEDDPWENP